MGGGSTCHMFHLSRGKWNLKSQFYILKTTLHVDDFLKWLFLSFWDGNNLEQRREYLFLTWLIKMIKMFKSKTINIISINVHLRNYQSHSENKNRLLGNLQKILNSHFLTSSSLFFSESWEIVIRVIILTLNLHEHVTVITVRYSVRGYEIVFTIFWVNIFATQT